MTDLPLATAGAALTPDRIKAHLATITEPSEIGETIGRFDAWAAALREVGTNTELLIDAVYSAMEARIRAVDIYDEFDNEPGRPGKNSGNAFPELSAKQQAQLDMKVTGRAIGYWRMVKDNVPDEERLQVYLDHRHRMDERFGISVYLDIARRHKHKTAKEVKAAEAALVLDGDIEESISILHGDFIEVCSAIPDDSVDLIFTDPPYDDASVWMYEPLAEIAARVLKPGGSLITYAGHHALPNVLNLMTPHLRFWWTLALHHNGMAARLPGKWVFVHWKPMLWFVKEGRRDNEFVADYIESHQPDKILHEWQQDMSEASYYIEHLTDPGDHILDPFCGSGTTCLAALSLGRRATGIEKDEARMQLAKGRIYEYSRQT